MNILKKLLHLRNSFILISIILMLFIHTISFAKETDPEPIFKKKLYTSTFDATLYPQTSFTNLIHKNVIKITPNIGGEVLHSFETKPSKNISPKELDQKMIEVLLNTQSLKGILYYSNSRQRYREFILESYNVNSVQDKNKIKEKNIKDITFTPVVGNPNIVQYSFLTYQEDSSFGKGTREVSIYYNETKHEVFMSITNLETVKYKGFITIAPPKSMTLLVLIQRVGNTYKEYMLVGTNTNVNINAIREKASKSLTYRMYAMGIWFESQLKKIL